MHNEQQHGTQQSDHKTVQRKEMTRRQFLSYTLGGTGGFLAALPLLSNLRFAIDPILQPKKKTAWVKVVAQTEVTDVPKVFKFKRHQVDGWYESDPEFQAYITKDDKGKIFALSPVCKHLGCTIGWDTNPTYKNLYFCPCHGAHYTKDGKNLAVAPNPLDEYDVKIENGNVYLGTLKPNTRVK